MNAYPFSDGTYHVETGLPIRLLRLFLGRNFGLEYGIHARAASLSDRYGPLTFAPRQWSFSEKEIIECEVENGELMKFVARIQSGFKMKQSGEFDLVLVCVPSHRVEGNLFVKTLWLNERNDNHTTLDTTKFIRHKK